MDRYVVSRGSPWRRWKKVNFASNGYLTVTHQTALPAVDDGTAAGRAAVMFSDNLGSSTQGVGSSFNTNTGMVPNGILLMPFAIGSNHTAFNLRVIGWSCLAGNYGGTTVNDNNNLWLAEPLVEVQATISSSQVGVANTLILSTELFAHTITLVGTTGNPGVNCDLNSPANDTNASVWVDLKSNQGVEVIFTTGGTVTSCNTLYKFTY